MNLIKIINIATPQLLARSLYPKEWQSPKHISYIEKKLINLFNKGNQKLIINMPPRHGKSQLITKIFPLWWLLNRPKDRIIISSYNSGLAEYFGREILDNFKKVCSDYGLELNSSQKSKSEFVTNQNGGLLSVGVGGTLTGKGANLIIIDDPIKNDAEANSVTMRDFLYDWFTATLLTRLEPNASIVLVMTRWHEDDLAGRLLKLKSWNSLILPAIATHNDALGRKVGAALWHRRYSKSSLLRIKEDIGGYWFAGLYQQIPAPSAGGLFKKANFKYMEIINEIAKSSDFNLNLTELDKFFACDLAISTNEKSDYTVVLVFAIDNDKNLFVLDVFREKILPTKHLEVISNLYEKHHPLLIGVETVQYQASLFYQLNNAGLPVTKLVPMKDKVTRALPLSAKFESGKVYFSKSLSSLDEIENELLNFPNGKHDDIVDALAYAVSMITNISGNKPIGYHKKKKSLLSGFG